MHIGTLSSYEILWKLSGFRSALAYWSVTARAKEMQPQQSIPHNLKYLVDPFGLLSLSLTDKHVDVVGNTFISVCFRGCNPQEGETTSVNLVKSIDHHLQGPGEINEWMDTRQWSVDVNYAVCAKGVIYLLVESQEWYRMIRQVLNNKITNKNRFRNTSRVSCKNSKVTLIIRGTSKSSRWIVPTGFDIIFYHNNQSSPEWNVSRPELHGICNSIITVEIAFTRTGQYNHTSHSFLCIIHTYDDNTLNISSRLLIPRPQKAPLI